MDHVTEIELIEHLGGHLPRERREAVEDHLAACDACRGRAEQLTETWGLLGEWAEPTRRRDLRRGVLDAASRRRSVWPAPWAIPALRAAAVVLLAVGVGYAAGRWSRPCASAEAVEEGQVAAQLYLGAFDAGTPAGLAESLLAGLPADGEVEQ